MRLEDREADAIDARLARRDAAVPGDHTAIVIDSYDDDRTASSSASRPAA